MKRDAWQWRRSKSGVLPQPDRVCLAESVQIAKVSRGLHCGCEEATLVLDTPVFLEPRIVPRVWGGDRISSEFGRPLEAEPIGESWEIHGDLKVKDTDKTLNQFMAAHGDHLVGRSIDPSGGFPLLTKWLDCRAWLSVQVHPDDLLAREFTGNSEARGKTEAWYVHRAADDSELIHGLADGVLPKQLEGLKGEAILPLLNTIKPEQGTLLHTPAGVVHALGPGNLIYEVQQSCDLTYRFYDWGRGREIHAERALKCLKSAQSGFGVAMSDKLICPFFEMELIREKRDWRVSEHSFEILAATSEPVQLSWESGSATLEPGQSVLLPAVLGKVSVAGEFKEPVIKVGSPA